MSELWQAVLLGLVQGLTEFLPISSTAHLALVPSLLGWDSPLLNSLTFDVALHMGTLVAVLLYFWRDWLALATGCLRAVAKRTLSDPDARRAGLLILGTVPAVLVGVLLEHYVDSLFRSPRQIALLLAGFSLVMVAAERTGRQDRALHQLGPFGALFIGLGQAIAIVPGVSRSGSTIAAGLALGLARADAARFSFLLATPIVAAAGAKRLLELREVGVAANDASLMVVGALVAGVFGWICIRWLLSYLARASLMLFVWYRLGFAALVLASYYTRG